MGTNFTFEKSEAKPYVADGVGGLVRFSHNGGKVNILRTAEAVGLYVSFVISKYITDILLRLISWLIDTGRKSFLILFFKHTFLHEMGSVC